MATKRATDMIQFTQQYNANVIHELEMKLAAERRSFATELANPNSTISGEHVVRRGLYFIELEMKLAAAGAANYVANRVIEYGVDS